MTCFPVLQFTAVGSVSLGGNPQHNEACIFVIEGALLSKHNMDQTQAKW